MMTELNCKEESLKRTGRGSYCISYYLFLASISPPQLSLPPLARTVALLPSSYPHPDLLVSLILACPVARHRVGLEGFSRSSVSLLQKSDLAWKVVCDSRELCRGYKLRYFNSSAARIQSLSYLKLYEDFLSVMFFCFFFDWTCQRKSISEEPMKSPSGRFQTRSSREIWEGQKRSLRMQQRRPLSLSCYWQRMLGKREVPPIKISQPKCITFIRVT